MLHAIISVFLSVPGFAATPLSRQEPLTSRQFDAIQLSSANPQHSFSFSVEGSNKLFIDVSTSAAPVTLIINDPGGHPIDPNTFISYSVAGSNLLPLGSVLFAQGFHIQANIANPVSGVWNATVSLPPGNSPTVVVISAISTGGKSLAVTVSRPTYFVGEVPVIGALAFNGIQPVSGANITANIYREGVLNPVQSIQLADNGVPPDALPGDGLYSGQVPGLLAGNYLVESVLNGGTYTKTAGVSFEVINTLGRLTGNISDQGVDTNSDNLFDRIDISVETNISVAGIYSIDVKLVATGGATLTLGARRQLAQGVNSMAVPFLASQIKESLGRDGPYQIAEVQLIKIAEDVSTRDLLADRLFDLGATNAYLLSQLQRPITLILQGIQEASSDTNGNGLIDQLRITFKVDTLRAGQYTWTGNLKTTDGRVVGVAGNAGSLSTGLNSLDFNFPGLPIGIAGVNGPFLVSDVAVYGPPDSAAVAAQIGQTSNLSSSQFEGGAITFDGLIVQLQQLVLTGVGGHPVGEGIRTSLLAKISNAKQLVLTGKKATAKLLLDAFNNQVRAQQGKHIAAVDAARLIGLATQLRSQL